MFAQNCMLGQIICSKLFWKYYLGQKLQNFRFEVFKYNNFSDLIKFLARIDFTVPLPLNNIFKVIGGPGFNF